MRLDLRSGQLVPKEELELYDVNIEVYIDGGWRVSTRALPLNIIEGLADGSINKIADDDSEEVAARIP